MEVLLIWVVFATIVAIVAYNKGRSTVGWFFIGFFLGLIGLILILCVSNLNDEREYKNSTDRERRRLREQLRQERVKNEAFRRHAASRLDHHDNALGIDTREANPALSAGDEPLMIGDDGQIDEPPPFQQKTAPPRKWFYVDRGQELGPVGESKLVLLLSSNQVPGNTPIWTKGMGAWKPADEVPAMVDALRNGRTS